MRIGELATQLGITAQSVRFYERSGLLKEPSRTESGYRQYSASDVKRLRFIRQAKELGFSLHEIGHMLRMHDAGQAPCAEVIAMAEGHLASVEAEIARLQRFRRQLSTALAEWRTVKTSRVAGSAICELIERTFATGERTDRRPKGARGQHPASSKSLPPRRPASTASHNRLAGAR